MSRVSYCKRCGEAFDRADDEYWKRLCLPCYKKTNRARRAQRAAPTVPANVQQALDEFDEHLPAIIRLAHPDKHSNSAAANRVTQWLLRVRNGGGLGK